MFFQFGFPLSPEVEFVGQSIRNDGVLVLLILASISFMLLFQVNAWNKHLVASYLEFAFLSLDNVKTGRPLYSV